MSKHIIESPWLVTALGDSFRVHTHTHTDVMCADENGEPCQWSEYNVATARLIAAAPELLEALKLCAVLVHDGNRQGDAAIETARAAIAKATGGAA